MLTVTATTRNRTLDHVRLALVTFYLRLRDRRQRATIVEVEGLPLLALPGVFPPDSFTTGLVLRNRHRLAGRDVLDMGCGAGALAVLSSGHVRSMAITDVNADATRCARLNLAWHGVEGVRVSTGDLFDGVEGTFDTIVFNAPFFPGTPLRESERNWRGGGSGPLLERFLHDVPAHLRPGGEIWLTHADIADEPGFRGILGRAGYSWSIQDELDIWIERFKLYRVLPGPEANPPEAHSNAACGGPHA